MVNGLQEIDSIFLNKNFKVKIKDKSQIVPPPGNYRIVSEFGDTDFPPIVRTAKSTRKKINTSENDVRSKEVLVTENNVNYK